MARNPGSTHRWAQALIVAAALVCAPRPALANDQPVDLVSAETLTVYGDARAVAVDGERSWRDGGFGKLRYGTDAGTARVTPQIGEAGVVWQPRLGWGLSGTVTGLVQGNGGRFDAGLSEAYLVFKPLGGGRMRVSARAGLMWPGISLEHGGPEWAVTDTITPSAIGSWLSEEVKVVGAELTGSTTLGGHQIAVTVAGFDWNDTAGALLTFRGWAMHDTKVLAFRAQPLPPLSDFAASIQPGYTHPLLNPESSPFKRPGVLRETGVEPAGAAAGGGGALRQQRRSRCSQRQSGMGLAHAL